MNSLSGNHKLDNVSDFVIKYFNYVRKNLINNKTIQSNEQQSKLFFKNRFKVRRLQINAQNDGWSCGFHSLLARQNFLQLLLNGCKFNEEFFKNKKRLIVINTMKGGKVDEIRSTLLQILTFMDVKKTKRMQKQQQTNNDLVINLEQVE